MRYTTLDDYLESTAYRFGCHLVFLAQNVFYLFALDFAIVMPENIAVNSLRIAHALRHCLTQFTSKTVLIYSNTYIYILPRLLFLIILKLYAIPFLVYYILLLGYLLNLKNLLKNLLNRPVSVRELVLVLSLN
jgi:hypothetical protein